MWLYNTSLKVYNMPTITELSMVLLAIKKVAFIENENVTVFIRVQVILEHWLILA